jgi:hypothetical protein
MENEHPRRCAANGLEDVRLPHHANIAAIVEAGHQDRFLGSAILISPIHALTCQHVLDQLGKTVPLWLRIGSVSVRVSKIAARSEERDLALLTLSEQANTDPFHLLSASGDQLLGLLRTGKSKIVGYQLAGGLAEQQEIHDIRVRQILQAGDGAVESIQIDGGVPDGFSGGGGLICTDGEWIAFGQTRLGGESAASSRLTSSSVLARFCFENGVSPQLVIPTERLGKALSDGLRASLRGRLGVIAPLVLLSYLTGWMGHRVLETLAHPIRWAPLFAASFLLLAGVTYSLVAALLRIAPLTRASLSRSGKRRSGNSEPLKFIPSFSAKPARVRRFWQLLFWFCISLLLACAYGAFIQGDLNDAIEKRFRSGLQNLNRPPGIDLTRPSPNSVPTPPRPVLVSGEVRDQISPLRNALVVLRDLFTGAVKSVVTDGNGRYSIMAGSPDVQLTVAYPGYATRSRTLHLGRNPSPYVPLMVSADLDSSSLWRRAGTLRLLVVDQRGRPQAGIQAVIKELDAKNEEADIQIDSDEVGETISDANGMVSIAAPPGNYRVTIAPAGCGAPIIRDLRVLPGTLTTAKPFMLRAPEKVGSLRIDFLPAGESDLDPTDQNDSNLQNDAITANSLYLKPERELWVREFWRVGMTAKASCLPPGDYALFDKDPADHPDQEAPGLGTNRKTRSEPLGSLRIYPGEESQILFDIFGKWEDATQPTDLPAGFIVSVRDVAGDALVGAEIKIEDEETNEEVATDVTGFPAGSLVFEAPDRKRYRVRITCPGFEPAGIVVDLTKTPRVRASVRLHYRMK